MPLSGNETKRHGEIRTERSDAKHVRHRQVGIRFAVPRCGEDVFRHAQEGSSRISPAFRWRRSRSSSRRWHEGSCCHNCENRQNLRGGGHCLSIAGLVAGRCAGCGASYANEKERLSRRPATGGPRLSRLIRGSGVLTASFRSSLRRQERRLHGFCIQPKKEKEQ